MTTLRSRVAKQRNQTNSNLLGMVAGAKAPGPNIQSSSRGYSVRPVARAIKTKHAGLNLEDWAIFFWGGPARKVSGTKPANSQALKP